jgi:ribosome-associated translation inhibitor RaiA
MNLYDLNKEFEKAILHISQLDDDLVVDETTGEVISQDVYADMLNAIDMARDEKLKNCLYYIKSLESDEDVIAKEIKRLQGLKATKTNAIARFKDYVLDNVDKGEKLDFQTIKLSCVAGLESVQVDADAQVPQEYCTIKVTPNKTELKKALKGGIEIAGVSIVKTEKRLMIK